MNSVCTANKVITGKTSVVKNATWDVVYAQQNTIVTYATAYTSFITEAVIRVPKVVKRAN
jgi:hypothetical protein